MRDVAVGQADAQDARSEARVRQCLPDRRAEAAREHALLDGHQQLVLGGELRGEPGVDRLGEAGVGDGHGDPAGAEDLGRRQGLADSRAVGEQSDPGGAGVRGAGLPEDLAGPDLDRRRLRGELDADPLAARVTQRDRAVVVAQRGVEHVHQHSLVARGHEDDVGQAAQVGDVEHAVVGRPVIADQARTVHREHDVQLLEADVVHDLVIGALQEGGVDGRDRLTALERQPGREQHRLLLGDPDVVVAVGQLALENVEPGAGVHRRGDPDHPVIAPALPHQGLAEHLGVGGRGGLEAGGLAAGGGGRAVGDRVRFRGVPFLHALEAALLGGGEPLALDGRAVHDHGPFGGQRLAQRPSQSAHVVAVDDPHVGEVQLLPPQAGGPEGLQRLLEVRTDPLKRRADAGGELGQAAFDALARVPQLRVHANAVEVPRERSDVRSDRHSVVVEHDDDRRALAAGLVNGLEGDSAGQRAVAGHRHHVAVRAMPAAHRLLDADGVPDRGRGVARAHDVVLGFLDRAERGQPLVLADRVQLVAPAGQDLVGIGLVADVPEDLVAGRIEQRVERDRDLAGPEVGAEMAADLPHGVDDVLAHLLGHLLQLVVGQAVKVLGTGDGWQEVCHQ